MGPKYQFLKESRDNPGPQARRALAEHVTEEGFRSEFVGGHWLLETHLGEVMPLVRNSSGGRTRVRARPRRWRP